jgi:hypothetical protein
MGEDEFTEMLTALNEQVEKHGGWIQGEVAYSKRGKLRHRFFENGKWGRWRKGPAPIVTPKNPTPA